MSVMKRRAMQVHHLAKSQHAVSMSPYLELHLSKGACEGYEKMTEKKESNGGGQTQ